MEKATFASRIIKAVPARWERDKDGPSIHTDPIEWLRMKRSPFMHIQGTKIPAKKKCWSFNDRLLNEAHGWYPSIKLHTKLNDATLRGTIIAINRMRLDCFYEYEGSCRGQAWYRFQPRMHDAHVLFLASHFCLDRLDGNNRFSSRNCASRRALSGGPLHHNLREGMYGRIVRVEVWIQSICKSTGQNGIWTDFIYRPVHL